ncbi:hypothetical protein VL08_13785 [Bacillus subtilis]|uniref:hypothetical protein n=1 Tax=Bacillus subtilis TaxID=1423 RepID=UPI00065D29A3|nr:hypothetical protein [Bacillus subtilis]KMN94520.1 hypothetical protein VL08_13785 [Bacillus subtilis]
MIFDITQSYNKQNRQRLSDRYYPVDLLKTIIYNNKYDPEHIKLEIKSKLHDKNVGKSTVFRMVDNDFKSCLLYEGNLQFNKALYNWSSYKRLVSKGLWSWAYVTLYYAQFYAVTGLLNIQGNVFTRPVLREKEHQFHIYPENFEDGVFILESRRLNKPHEDVWRQYYNVYRRARYKLQDYNELYQYDEENQFKAIHDRNFTNYDISYKFLEYEYSREELKAFQESMSRNIFLVKDRNRFLNIEYIASLRIKLLYEQLDEILTNNEFKEVKTNFNNKRKEMLELTIDDTPVRSIFQDWILE